MDKNAWWKWLVLVAAIAASVILVTPLKSKVRLGLDLQGGYSFTLQLDEVKLRETLRDQHPDKAEIELDGMVVDAIKNADEVAVEIIRNRIDPLGVEEPVITRGKDRRIYVQLPGATAEKRAEAERSVRSVAFLEFRLVHADNERLVNRLMESDKTPEGYRIVTVNDRKYYDQAENFKEVAKDPIEFARKLARFEVPDKAYAFMLEQTIVNGAKKLYRPIFVNRRNEMTGRNLKKAAASFDEYNRPIVRLEFNMEGSREFDRVTSRYCPDGERNKNNRNGRQLAIVLDGTVYSAPEIENRIPDGNAIIRGSFTQGEVNFLRTVLNAGALPAPLKFMGQRFVSPTLGEDAIQGAIKAMLWGVGAVLLFMLVYYRFCGLIANAAFLLDLVLLPVGAVIASGVFGLLVPETSQSGGSLMRLPVLTLPGIAGILLTLGMAVDGNVLIFERIREELQSGKRLFAATMAGYDRAFLAILDSNVTTVLTAIILFVFGSGLIRGFAVMLTAGIIVSMFTVLVVTKLIFQAVIPETSDKKYSMMKLVSPKREIDFLGKRKAYILGAVAIIVATNLIGIVRGVRDPSSVFAVDFTGGAKIAYTVKDRTFATPEDVRAVAVAAGVTDAAPQYQSDDDLTYLDVKTVMADVGGVEVDKVLTEALKKAMPNAGIEYMDVDSVGSQIGSEMKRSAVIAIILSLLGMIAYLTLRFEFGFALGAFVALVHDVFITLGIYLVLGNQISLTIVAALLTIVGYSVNDTIVIFDRIREELKKDQRTNIDVLCNRCINLTLSRTILTSTTSLLTVFSLLIFAKGDIRDFAVTMVIGMVTGVFSTIFIATPVMLAWHRHRRPTFGKG